MSAARIVVQWRRFGGRLLALRLLLRRIFLRELIREHHHLVRFRIKPGVARRLRFVCALLRRALLRRLTIPARSRESIGFRLRPLRQVAETGADVQRRGRSATSGNRIATMKRSRRVVLTSMGSAAIGAVSMGLVPRRDCGPGNIAVPGPDGRMYCRATYHGFGGAPHRLHGHGGHGHGHGGG
jgi:hypothetical protein